MEKKTIAFLIAVVVLAFASVFLLVGITNRFQKRIDYLSDKYAIYECKIKWIDYPSKMNERAMFRNYEYEVRETKSWTAFKSLLQESKGDGTLLSLFYEPESHIIWFDKLDGILSGYSGVDYINTNGDIKVRI